MEFGNLPFLENVREMAVEYNSVLKQSADKRDTYQKHQALNYPPHPPCDGYQDHMDKIYGKYPCPPPIAAADNGDIGENSYRTPAEEKNITDRHIYGTEEVTDDRTGQKETIDIDPGYENGGLTDFENQEDFLPWIYGDGYNGAPDGIDGRLYEPQDYYPAPPRPQKLGGTSNNTPDNGGLNQNQSDIKRNMSGAAPNGSQSNRQNNLSENSMNGNQYNMQNNINGNQSDGQNNTPQGGNRQGRQNNTDGNQIKEQNNAQSVFENTSRNNVGGGGRRNGGALDGNRNNNMSGRENTGGNRFHNNNRIPDNRIPDNGRIHNNNRIPDNRDFNRDRDNGRDFRRDFTDNAFDGRDFRGGDYRNLVFFANNLKNICGLLNEQMAILRIMRDLTPVPYLKEQIDSLIALKDGVMKETSHIYSSVSPLPLDLRSPEVIRGRYVNLYNLLNSLQSNLDQNLAYLVNNRFVSGYINSISGVIAADAESRSLIRGLLNTPR
jgi:hypothetical protein